MTFIDWLSINLIVDISFVVFATACVWQMRKMKKKISEIDKKLKLTIKNPQQARRILKSWLNKTKNKVL